MKTWQKGVCIGAAVGVAAPFAIVGGLAVAGFGHYYTLRCNKVPTDYYYDKTMCVGNTHAYYSFDGFFFCFSVQIAKLVFKSCSR